MPAMAVAYDDLGGFEDLSRDGDGPRKREVQAMPQSVSDSLWEVDKLSAGPLGLGRAAEREPRHRSR